MSHICSIIDYFLFKPILAAIFVTIATVKVKFIPNIYTWDIVLINQCEKSEK